MLLLCLGPLNSVLPLVHLILLHHELVQRFAQRGVQLREILQRLARQVVQVAVLYGGNLVLGSVNSGLSMGRQCGQLGDGGSDTPSASAGRHPARHRPSPTGPDRVDLVRTVLEHM